MRNLDRKERTNRSLVPRGGPPMVLQEATAYVLSPTTRQALNQVLSVPATIVASIARDDL